MKKEFLRKLGTTVIYTALVFAVTWLTGRMLSLGDGAYLHAGDALVYLSVVLLPLPQALFASAVGTFAADIVMGSAFAPATVVVKALAVAAAYGFTRLSVKPLYQDLLICLSGLVTVGGYSLYALIAGMRQYALYDALQAAVCAAIYIVISGFVRGRKEKKNEKDTDSAVDDVCGPDGDTPQS